MRVFAVLICVAFIGLSWLFLVRGICIDKFRDNNVVVGEVKRPWDVFAAHVARPQYLRVGGKTFLGIRGLAPCYLNVPGRNAILFVTQEPGDHIRFHFFDLTTKEEVGIDGGTSGFGWGIGGTRKPGEKYTDYIEDVESDRVRVAIRSGDWKETMVLNLVTRSIERRETLHFNASGEVTNRSVQTNVIPTVR